MSTGFMSAPRGSAARCACVGNGPASRRVGWHERLGVCTT